MAASATFALKAGVWFRRGRLLIVSPDSLGTACLLSGRNSAYRPVQILEAGPGALIASRRRFSVVCRWWWVAYVLDGPFDLIEIVRNTGLDLSILGAAVPVPKPMVRMIRSIDCWLLSSENSHGKSVHWCESRGGNTHGG
jgi:hypothetical protein